MSYPDCQERISQTCFDEMSGDREAERRDEEREVAKQTTENISKDVSKEGKGDSGAVSSPRRVTSRKREHSSSTRLAQETAKV